MAESKARNHNKIALIFTGRLEEYPNDASDLQPGMLVVPTSAGRVKKHNFDGGPGECLIVDVDLMSGMTVDDIYDGAQDTERIPVLIPQEGDVLAVLLEDGVEVVKDVTRLTSNGEGAFKIATDNDQVMFIAHESMTSGDSSGFAHCKARRVSTFINSTADSE